MRLCKACDFTNIFRYGCRFHFRALTLLVVDNNLGYPRLGIVVPKRRVRFAHQRNRIKRVIRNAFRHHRALFGAKDAVVMVRGDAIKGTAEMVEAVLKMQGKGGQTKHPRSASGV